MRVRRALVPLATAAAGWSVGHRASARKASPAGVPSGGTGPVALEKSPGGHASPDDPAPQGPGQATSEEQAGAGVPGGGAEKPTDIPAEGWKQILKRAWKEAKDDNVPLLAAGVAYYAFIALFPALIAAVTLYGLIADPAQVQEQVSSLTDTLPAESATLIKQQLTDIAAGSSGALGFGLIVSVLGALFTASGGVGNLMKAINIAYDEQETRGAIKTRAIALLLTLGAIVFLIVAVALVAVLPVVLDHVGLGSVGQFFAGVVRFLALIAFMIVALSVLYRYAPDRDSPKFSWVSLGAGVATLLWIVGSIAFSLYVSNFGKYGKTYGALAGVIVLLLWLFLTAYIVLLGAEINSEMEQQTAKDTTKGPPQPMGERRAVKADTVAGDAA